MADNREILVMEFDEPQPYRTLWELQHACFDAQVERKRSGLPSSAEYLLLLEHQPVLTLGKHGHAENLLLPSDMLAARGIECIRIERGGDITYHGPGQIVAYPIIDLERHHLGVKAYVDILEEAVIRTIAEYGVIGQRVEGASGVWIGKGTPDERKICALGVKCTRFITMHGLALNVSTDLSAFTLINPCGFTDRGVTSLHRECAAAGRELPSISEVRGKLKHHLLTLLHATAKDIPASSKLP